MIEGSSVSTGHLQLPAAAPSFPSTVEKQSKHQSVRAGGGDQETGAPSRQGLRDGGGSFWAASKRQLLQSQPVSGEEEEEEEDGAFSELLNYT